MCLPSKKSVTFEPCMPLSDLFLLTLPAGPQLLTGTSFSAPVPTRAAATQALHSGWESLSSLEMQQFHLLPPPYNRPVTPSSPPRCSLSDGTAPSASWEQSLGTGICTSGISAFPGHSPPTYLGFPREKKCAAVRQLKSNRMNTGWEGDGGSKTVSLTFFLTCIWLWVLHYATLIEIPCSGVTWICKHLQCQQTWRGGWSMPSWRLFHRKVSRALTSPLRWQGTNLQRLFWTPYMELSLFTLRTFIPYSQQGAQGLELLWARKRSACHDLASPEIVGKLSETAWSSALDQAANYKTWLTLQAYLTPMETDSRAHRICAAYKHQLVFKWSLISLPQNL